MRFSHFTFWKLVRQDDMYVAVPYIIIHSNMVEWHLSPSQIPGRNDA